MRQRRISEKRRLSVGEKSAEQRRQGVGWAVKAGQAAWAG